MNMKHVLSVLPDGTINCLWTDSLPLAELGNLEIKRASTIEFSELMQMWEVCIDGTPVYSSPSRSACLEWEHEHFNNQLLNN